MSLAFFQDVSFLICKLFVVHLQCIFNVSFLDIDAVKVCIPFVLYPGLVQVVVCLLDLVSVVPESVVTKNVVLVQSCRMVFELTITFTLLMGIVLTRRLSCVIRFHKVLVRTRSQVVG